MAIVTINNRELEIADDGRLNVIQAAARLGIEIPHYCWHPGLSVVASCRMCLVETGRRDPDSGKVTMLPKLTPACQMPVVDGMVVVTNSEKVQRAVAQVEEGLLLRHPIDCPICDKAGECLLQDYHFRYGQNERRADLKPFTSERRDLGDVALFVNRCIMCSRCVRFVREITGTGELMVIRRGAHEEIDVMTDFPLHNNLSGNVVDLCPVGALGDKDFLYKQRVWYMRRHKSVCTGCATGCSIWVEENQDRIYRLRPRDNPHVNQWWICNEGRYGYPHVHDPRRLLRPWRRDGQTAVDVDWKTLPAELNERLRTAGRLAGVISPHVTVEAAWLLCTWLRRLDPEAPLVLGPVPRVGEDERFPNGFVIRAEKCPNRRGVEEVIAHFARKVETLDDLLPRVEQGEIDGVWVAGGYKREWIDEPTAERLAKAKLLVVQDLFPSPLSDRATYALPAAAMAECDGSYVNLADRLQRAPWAIRPPTGVRREESLFWEMLGREGLYSAQAVLNDIAREIRYFSAAAGGGGGVPEVGIDLKLNLLARQDAMS